MLPTSAERERSLSAHSDAWTRSIDTSVLPEIRASLVDRKNLVVLEGLPHQSWERDLLKSELGSKETTKIHGFHFYSTSKAFCR